MRIPQFLARRFNNKIGKILQTGLFMGSTLALSHLFLDNTPSLHRLNFAEEANLPNIDHMFQAKPMKLYQICLGDLDYMHNQESLIVHVTIPSMKLPLPVIIIKDKLGQFTAFRGNCPYEPSKVMDGAMVFEDKLVCPHHGCQFSIETGEVEHSPAIYNLVKLELKDLRPFDKYQRNFLYRNFEKGEHYMSIEDEQKIREGRFYDHIKSKFSFGKGNEADTDTPSQGKQSGQNAKVFTGNTNNGELEHRNRSLAESPVIFDNTSPDIKFQLYIPEIIPHKMYPQTYFDIPQDPRRVVIIGNGPAGISCAETLRKNQFTGRIFVISDSDYMPYDKRKVRLDFDVEDSISLDDKQYLFQFFKFKIDKPILNNSSEAIFRKSYD